MTGHEGDWLDDMATAFGTPPVDVHLAGRIVDHLRTLAPPHRGPGVAFWIVPFAASGLAAALLWAGAAIGVPVIAIARAAAAAAAALGTPAVAATPAIALTAAAIILGTDTLLVLWIIRHHRRHAPWERA